jgi:hypothetical protein
MSDDTFRKAKPRPALGAQMPESLADRFMLCPICREEYDMRDLGEVLQHLHPSGSESDCD